MDIDLRFQWLINMDFNDAQEKMLEHHPYYLYAYYINGENYFITTNLDLNRIHVRVENGIVTQVNGCG